MSGFVLKEDADIWDNDSGIVLIPVNCVGVMGLGLAKDCKERHPDVYKDYRKACKSGNFNINTLKLYMIKDDFAILLFPTKYEWREYSRIEWVEDNLKKLGTCLSRSPIDVFHVPPIGCGAGGLDYNEVRPMIEHYLNHDRITVNLYQPT